MKKLTKKDQQSAGDLFKESKRLGIEWHNLAVEEQRGAAEKAVKILKPLVKKASKDYEVLAYLGSSLMMVGRDSWNPLTKMTSVNKGIDLVDKAVEKDKDNITIRLVRVYSSLSLPDYLGRKSKIKPDFDYLIDIIQRKDATLDEKSEIYFLMGRFLMNEKDQIQSIDFLNQAIKINPDSIWANKAQELISD